MSKLQFPNRRGSSSIKHDYLKMKFGIDHQDMIPLWVADMDIATPDFLSDAIKQRAEHPVYGYTLIDIKEPIINWQKRHDFLVKKDWIVPLPNVVFGLGFSVLSFSKEGEKVIVTPPVYPPFFDVISKHKRVVAKNPLLKGDRYQFDFDHFDSEAKIFFLCNPHNPVGRVWEKEELKRVGDFCLENNIIIVSDEIHADFIYQGNCHVPMASISKEIADITITLNSASKTFNISGLSTAYAIISNDKLRDVFHHYVETMHLYPNIFGSLALSSAYLNGNEWPKQVMRLIEENSVFVIHELSTLFPKLTIARPEGTYLLWLDFSQSSLSHDEIEKLLLHKAHVALSSGRDFGVDKTFRLNLATSKEVLTEALNRISKIDLFG